MGPTRRGLLVTVAVGVVSCGSSGSSSEGPTGVDISGMYEVSHHTTSASDCINEGTEITSLEYFRVLPVTKGYAAVRCMGADVSSCPSDLNDAALGGDLIIIVDKVVTDGWAATSSSGSTISGCTLSFSTASALLSGDELRIEDRRYADHPTLAAAACTQAEALSRADSMPCDQFDVFVGTRQ